MCSYKTRTKRGSPGETFGHLKEGTYTVPWRSVSETVSVEILVSDVSCQRVLRTLLFVNFLKTGHYSIHRYKPWQEFFRLSLVRESLQGKRGRMIYSVKGFHWNDRRQGGHGRTYDKGNGPYVKERTEHTTCGRTQHSTLGSPRLLTNELIRETGNEWGRNLVSTPFRTKRDNLGEVTPGVTLLLTLGYLLVQELPCLRQIHIGVLGPVMVVHPRSYWNLVIYSMRTRVKWSCPTWVVRTKIRFAECRFFVVTSPQKLEIWHKVTKSVLTHTKL